MIIKLLQGVLKIKGQIKMEDTEKQKHLQNIIQVGYILWLKSMDLLESQKLPFKTPIEESIYLEIKALVNKQVLFIVQILA